VPGGPKIGPVEVAGGPKIGPPNWEGPVVVVGPKMGPGGFGIGFVKTCPTAWD